MDHDLWYIYTRNNDMEFEGKWMQWRTSYKLKLARIRNTKDTCFLSYIVDRTKDKHIYKNKHDHIQTQLHFCNSETNLWNSGKEGKKKRMIEYQ
jgi:hypothetical protein